MWVPSTWQNSAQNLYSCDSLPKPEFSTYLESSEGGFRNF
ncbi:L51_S25_CI-B8 domain-containing protein, partial [Meloidogyne graminicola]